MKAIDFIRKFGWGHSIYVVNEWINFFDQFETQPPTCFIPSAQAFVNSEDNLFVSHQSVSLVHLKSYVEAFNLVESKGGLKKCLQFFPENHMNGLLNKAIILVKEVGILGEGYE